jgi:hypothetical protein
VPEGLHLVLVETIDTQPAQELLQLRVEIQDRAIGGLNRRQVPVVGVCGPKVGVPLDRLYVFG